MFRDLYLLLIQFFELLEFWYPKSGPGHGPLGHIKPTLSLSHCLSCGRLGMINISLPGNPCAKERKSLLQVWLSLVTIKGLYCWPVGRRLNPQTTFLALLLFRRRSNRYNINTDRSFLPQTTLRGICLQQKYTNVPIACNSTKHAPERVA